MKNKSIISIVLSLLLVCLLSVAAFAADADTGESTAKINFVEGDLEFADKADLDDDMQDMDIDFEERDIPVVDTTFVAEDGDHTLRVLDPRTNAGGWKVTVSMGKFEEDGAGTSSFNGTITLADAVLTSTNNGTDWGMENSEIIIKSNELAVKVVDTGSLERDAFDMTWEDDNISLDVTAVEAAHIEVNKAYTATLTWTLADA